MEPLTPLETLCRIIIRAKEYEAQVPTEYDEGEDPDNIDDDGDGGETLSVLDDAVNDSVEKELTSVLEDLGDDQLMEVIAFAWVGQGDYEASEWDEAMEAAGEFAQDGGDIIEELMEMPMLASTLESGMAAFDLSCEGIGDLT